MTMNPDASIASTPNPGVKHAAGQEAGRLKDKTQTAAQDVADTARQHAGEVKDEATTQVKGLAASVRDEATTQASTQQGRLAEQSRAVTDDLQRIARGERPQSPVVDQLVSTLAERAEQVTRQLETKEPADLLDDVRRFAARRPGTFLAIAAGVGLVAGRLTRGITDDARDSSGQSSTLPAPPARRPEAAPAPAPVDRASGTVYTDDDTAGISAPGGRA